MMVGPGVSSSIRSSMAKMPPRTNATVVSTRYMIPMRLWSRVKSQDAIPAFALR
jgi:hypothetical protein